MNEFKGKVALVTGAASGIGRAAAQGFARRGATVLVADVDDGGGAETVRLIEEKGGSARFQRCDVSREEDVADMVHVAVTQLGSLDCAFNNAGSPGAPGLMESYDVDGFRRVLDVNALGTFLCMKYELAEMVRSGGGAIVNTSSISGLGASPMMPAYVASKHAVTGLTKVAGLDYAAKDIRVNAVCPGVVDTPMMQAWIGGDEKIRDLMDASEPIGRMARPEEIAAVAVWLCSDAASFVTGAALPVDGGMTALAGGGASD